MAVPFFPVFPSQFLSHGCSHCLRFDGCVRITAEKDGSFTGITGIDGGYQLSSSEDAPALAGAILGIYQAETELAVQWETRYQGETYYRLNQRWEGYPVWGQGAFLLADADGAVYSAGSNYLRPEQVFSDAG